MQSVSSDLADRHGFRIHRTLLPPGAIVAAFALLIIGGMGPNIELALLSIVVLIAGCLLLWRPGESPILLFIFVLPWLQGSIAIFHANWLGMGVEMLAQVPSDMRTAILLTQAGLLVHALGLRIGAGRWRRQDAHLMHEQALWLPTRRWAQAYAGAWLVSFAALTFAWLVPGLAQILLAFVTLKWAFYFMLAYVAFAGAPGGRHILAVAFLVELALGIGGFFSDFKTVIFVTAFAAVASGVRMTAKRLFGIGALAMLVVALAIVWTAVKSDYRRFVSGGEVAQIVSVDYGARISHLAGLVGQLEGPNLSKAFDEMLGRLTYVEFFGATINYVPTYVPHQHGDILWDAISRPFMPRLFFPDKAPIDDSVRTNEFTGLGVAGVAEGTSISLGWIAEAYIDFGRYGMFLSILAISVFYGSIYRRLIRWDLTRGLFGAALATAVLQGAGFLESSITKVFGGVIVSLLMAWMLVKFILPRIAPWLLARSPRRARL
ncbi:hypothetical protein [Hyphomicrobium sp. CS1BSMeth3]|uniref:hypothetical protein n=1 Tax=Hyphomicrobium sp. CS1BSMeth3 TaxID=1892844 RepID=UPI0009304F08|nr:hypothetical protein [Hyphomicrobium sp. CS1BSMeth3]